MSDVVTLCSEARGRPQIFIMTGDTLLTSHSSSLPSDTALHRNFVNKNIPKSLGNIEMNNGYHLRSPHYESCSQSVTCVSWVCPGWPVASPSPDSCLVRLSYFCSVMNFPYSAAYCLKTTAINTQKWPYERNIRLIHGWEWVWVSDVKGGAHWVGNSFGTSFHFIILWHSQ